MKLGCLVSWKNATSKFFNDGIVSPQPCEGVVIDEKQYFPILLRARNEGIEKPLPLKEKSARHPIFLVIMVVEPEVTARFFHKATRPSRATNNHELHALRYSCIETHEVINLHFQALALRHS